MPPVRLCIRFSVGDREFYRKAQVNGTQAVCKPKPPLEVHVMENAFMAHFYSLPMDAYEAGGTEAHPLGEASKASGYTPVALGGALPHTPVIRKETL